MANFFLPDIAPSSSTWGLVSNTATFESPLTGAIQSIDRGGERWRVTLAYENLSPDDKATMKAFLSRVNGQQHRVVMGDQSLVQRGEFTSYFDILLVNGAGQTGNTVNLSGATPAVTDYFRAGDMFSIDGQLKMIVDAVTSGPSGELAVNFVPRLRQEAANGFSVTTNNPRGIFILATDTVSWQNLPGNFANLSIELFEDINI